MMRGIKTTAAGAASTRRVDLPMRPVKVGPDTTRRANNIIGITVGRSERRSRLEGDIITTKNCVGGEIKGRAACTQQEVQRQSLGNRASNEDSLSGGAARGGDKKQNADRTKIE